jgi:hypothetical protein
MSYRIIRVAVSTFIITAMACIPLHREVFDDPPAAVRAKDRLDARSPAAVVVVGPYISVQVNVDEFGQNIVGDAANEPSIAVNPIFPDNIVIGWRQFDSITSNFRQAGWAFSQDGGQNWTFPGVLTPGIFRSDPVLDSDSSGVIYYQSLQEDFDVDVFRSQPSAATRTGWRWTRAVDWVTATSMASGSDSLAVAARTPSPVRLMEPRSLSRQSK